MHVNKKKEILRNLVPTMPLATAPLWSFIILVTPEEGIFCFSSPSLLPLSKSSYST